MNRAIGLLAALALATPLSAACAQTAAQLVTDGVAAYEDLDFAQAARLLDRALSLEDQLSPAEQARALTYLAAAEVFQNRRTRATATFRRLLFLDPRQAPDSLRFPPQVRRVYEDVRRDTKVVTAVLPRSADITVGRDSLAARVYASSFHDLSATIEREDGSALRMLYSGPIRDSLTLQWDARSGDGAPVTPGSYRLTLTSRSGDGPVLRSLQVPLEISAMRSDTLPYPRLPDSLLVPERTSPAPGLIALTTAGAGAGLIALLPQLAGASGEAGSGRFVVVGTVGIAGIAGLVHRGLGRPIPQNVAANAAVRGAWRDSVAKVQQENARLRSARVVVRAGAPVRVEGEPR